MKKLFSKNFFIVLAVLIVIAAIFGYIVFQYILVKKDLKDSKEKEDQLESNVKNLEGQLSLAKEENTQLSELLEAETERNDGFSRQIQSISGQVSTLEKLKQIDKELLQKYSRVYFLNENYIPKNLVSIDEKYLSNKNKTILISKDVTKYLYSMMDDADSNGIPLQIISAYRSFGQQDALKDKYTVIYGSGANKFSADQGYSEHQLGTAVDFTTPKLGDSFTKIDLEPAYKWFLENAYKYGFILSYPEENSYYQFEPWHWRFVGVSLATKLHESNKNFYDMPQREIDTYLISIFD